jgi:type I restriction enzyme S subunit
MVAQYLINSKSVGSIQRNIYWATLKRTRVLVPPLEEQYKIVRFLDWKVLEINKLISIRRKEIAFLEEFKTKIINDAVIKGLRKTPLKHNDDIRWDIDYSSTWNLKRVREIFSFRKGLSITKANLEETGIPVISYGQVHSKKNTMFGLDDDIFKYVNPSYLGTNPSSLVTYGDFIFADTSEDIAGCGNCAYIDRKGDIFAGYHSIIAHPIDEGDNKYFAYLFKSPTWRYQIRKKVNGVKVYSVTQQILKDAFVLLPPEDEQREIVDYLDSMCNKVDVLIKKTEEKITNLYELKATIISDVVTGKIDVRGIEIPEYEFIIDSVDEEIDAAGREEQEDET